ncbi:MAG: hypothetical protein [Betabaculovirus sp.]|nr:MAG: hypothetical protein [Betabaculovirus sp.]
MCQPNKLERRTALTLKETNLAAIMNWWLNSIFDYLFGQRLEEIKKSLDELTQRVNYL